MNNKSKYEFFMKKAIEQAEKSIVLKEVPVGAVVVKDEEIISSGYNIRETSNIAVAHAEIIAIKKACEKLNSWRLIGCDIYVSLEPCLMCVGGIMNARIETLIYGASDTKYGCCGSILDITKYKYNHKLNIVRGILEPECSDILKQFFVHLRNK